MVDFRIGSNQLQRFQYEEKRMEIWVTAGGKNACEGRRAAYCTDWITTTPTVKAIITPTIITLEACWVMRITEVKTEIPSIAAINAAGAITKGISLVNQISVCILFFTRNDLMDVGRVVSQDIHQRPVMQPRR